MVFTLNNLLIFLIILLFVIAVRRELEEKRYGELLKEIRRFKKDPLLLIQRILNFIFRGFIIRQILNPYFLFPFLIVITILLRQSLTNSDLILLLTLVSLLWYSKETFELRKCQNITNKQTAELIVDQKKQLYLNLVEMEMRDKDSGYKARVSYPIIIRRIVEKGEFDPKTLYSKSWHQDI